MTGKEKEEEHKCIFIIVYIKKALISESLLYPKLLQADFVTM